MSLIKDTKLKHQPRNFVWAISLAITLLFSQLSYSACPSKSKEEWLQYFKIEADKLGASKSYYSEETNKIANQCAPTWNLLGLGQCSTRITIASDSREKTTNSGVSMGWDMSDKDYIKNIPKEFRSLPADLRDGLPDNYREVA